jgi:hypothetical protein
MRSVLGWAALAAVVATTTPAHADGLSRLEVDRLLHGQTVTRQHDERQGSHRFVGGMSYAIVDWGPEQVAALVDDFSLWKRVIPEVREAHRVPGSGDPIVDVVHGNALISVGYSMRVKRDGRVIRFWMDPKRRHDIQDVWGYFRLEPMADGRTLVIFGILIDLGDGMIRDLFEDRVRELALGIPDNVRSVIVERSSRGRRAAR